MSSEASSIRRRTAWGRVPTRLPAGASSCVSVCRSLRGVGLSAGRVSVSSKYRRRTSLLARRIVRGQLPQWGGGLSWHCLASLRARARPPELCACLPPRRGMTATRPVATEESARRAHRPPHLRCVGPLLRGALQLLLRTGRVTTARPTRAMPRRWCMRTVAASRRDVTRCGLWQLSQRRWPCLSSRLL